jgi:hypothetical protein
VSIKSSYPVDLEHGRPRRHHIVIYQHVRSSKCHEQVSIRIDPNEVDAYTWLTHEQIACLHDRTVQPAEHLRSFTAHVHRTGQCQLPFDILTTADYCQAENLTNGTRFALEQLHRLRSSSTNIDDDSCR